MEIKSIKNPEVSSFDLKEKQNAATTENVTKKPKNVPSIESLSDWQVGVLQLANKYLENMNQVYNNHPLGRKEYKTIETLEEALEELEKTRSSSFQEEAKPAQANLTAEQVLHLFLQ